MNAKYCLFGILFLFFSSCAPSGSWNEIMYTGPQRPADQLSFIKAYSILGATTLDGTPIRLWARLNAMWIEIEPGPHTLTMQYYSTTISGQETTFISPNPITISFDAKAGSSYAIGNVTYYQHGDDIYSHHYAGLKPDDKIEVAEKCGVYSLLNWTPQKSELKWQPYIYNFNDQSVVSQIDDEGTKEIDKILKTIKVQKDTINACLYEGK